MSDKTENTLTERLKVTYVEGCKGPLFCLLASGAQPEDANSSGGHDETVADIKTTECSIDHFVLFVPPFGEEVNLCRRFHSLVRAQLAQAGAICVLPDLFGTGDSAGMLHEADHETWLHDLQKVIVHFCCQRNEGVNSHRLSIVATRAGCLLAADLLLSLQHLKDKPLLENIVFVQPEKNGKDVIGRLFRARIMTQRLAGNRSEDSGSLWAAVEKGLSVHAGGSTLSSELCLSLRRQKLDDFLPATLARKQSLFNLYVSGLDESRNVGQNAERHPLPSWNVHEHITPPFWQTYEVEPDHSLVEAVARAAAQIS